MANREEILVFLMIIGVAAALVSEANLTGKAIVYRETSATMDLCRLNNLPDNCIFTERPISPGVSEKTVISLDDWTARLLNFGVDCADFKQGKMTLDNAGNPTSVEILIGSNPVVCKFNGVPYNLPAKSQILYTGQTITVLLPQGIRPPQIISSEIFPAASQTSTRNTVQVCFMGVNKYSLVNAELKSSSGAISTVALFDDGNHFDKLKGDGCYGAVLDGLLTQGQYLVSYVVSA